jgi:hypothetical protein
MDHRERKYEEEFAAAAVPRQRAGGHPLDGRSEDHASSSGGADAGNGVGGSSGDPLRGDPLRGGGGGGFADSLRAGMEYDDPLRSGGTQGGPLGGGPLGVGDGGGGPGGPGGGGGGRGVSQLSRDERASEVMMGGGGGSSRARDLLLGGGEDAEVLAEWESRKQSIHHKFSGQGTIQACVPMLTLCTTIAVSSLHLTERCYVVCTNDCSLFTRQCYSDVVGYGDVVT